jgi:hypothetical protein
MIPMNCSIMFISNHQLFPNMCKRINSQLNRARVYRTSFASWYIKLPLIAFKVAAMG